MGKTAAFCDLHSLPASKGVDMTCMSCMYIILFTSSDSSATCHKIAS